MTVWAYPETTIVSVHDGDTITADISMGRHIWCRNAKHRLMGCAARELAMPGGPEARDNLAGLLAGTVVTLTSLKPYKYGDEYMAQITLPDGRDLVTLLIEQQWAVAWDGRGKQPTPPWPRMI